MRCDEVREILAEKELLDRPVALRDHLAACPECAAEARAWRLARQGFASLGGDPVSEASLGFADRLLRRIEAERARGAAVEFIESVGRRVVLATGLLALALLLGLLLPSAGPLGSSANAEMALAATEIKFAENDPILAPESEDNSNVVVAPSSGEAHRGDKK